MMLRDLLSIFTWFKFNLNKLLKYKKICLLVFLYKVGGLTTQDPLYPEGHPKRIEQESQLAENNITSSPKKKKKKKKHKELGEASNMEIDKEPTSNNPNDVSISDAETESGNEHDNDTNEPEEQEEETAPPVAKKHGREREPWVQKPMPFPSKSHKTKEEEHYNKFCEWMKPLFLQIPLTDAIKLPPYSKYMKDIVSNKRKFL